MRCAMHSKQMTLKKRLIAGLRIAYGEPTELRNEAGEDFLTAQSTCEQHRISASGAKSSLRAGFQPVPDSCCASEFSRITGFASHSASFTQRKPTVPERS